MLFCGLRNYTNVVHTSHVRTILNVLFQWLIIYSMRKVAHLSDFSKGQITTTRHFGKTYEFLLNMVRRRRNNESTSWCLSSVAHWFHRRAKTITHFFIGNERLQCSRSPEVTTLVRKTVCFSSVDFRVLAGVVAAPAKSLFVSHVTRNSVQNGPWSFINGSYRNVRNHLFGSITLTVECNYADYQQIRCTVGSIQISDCSIMVWAILRSY